MLGVEQHRYGYITHKDHALDGRLLARGHGADDRAERVGGDLRCHHYDFRSESLTVDATGIGVKFGRDSGVADAVDKDGKSVSGCVGSQRAA